MARVSYTLKYSYKIHKQLYVILIINITIYIEFENFFDSSTRRERVSDIELKLEGVGFFMT